jgi:hypothetical protein
MAAAMHLALLDGIALCSLKIVNITCTSYYIALAQALRVLACGAQSHAGKRKIS